MDCIFCKIIEGEIPAEKVYEDDSVVAFLDVNPISLGHTMVIPKIHISNLLDLPDDKVEPFFKGVKIIAGMIEKALSPSGYTMGLNHGKVSGQVVDHLHFHIIPRFEGDDGGSIQSVVNNPPEEELSEVAEKIRQADK